MAIAVGKLSWWDTLRLQLLLTIPGFLLGLVAPNRLVLSAFAALGGGGSTMRFLNGLRERYGCDHLWVWFPGGKTLLVLNPDTIDAVLDSTDNAADPPLKKRALSRFVPDALLISSGEEWRERRAFNEEALCTGKAHRHIDAFREIVVREIEQLESPSATEMRWADFQRLGTRISQQVIMGAGELRPEMGEHLARMVRRSNWLLRDESSFAGFYRQIDRDLARDSQSAPACLMRDSAAQIESGRVKESTKVPPQIGFWLFVLKDAIELHVARTLVLIAAHPECQRRVRDEIRSAGTLTVQSIDGLHYLGACIAEQLRLWTPVPLLLRRALRPFAVRNEIPIDTDQQILIDAAFYHRDARVFGALADRFSPESVDGTFPAVYFFSRHHQSCAGRTLVTFVLKATLASLLGRFRVELIGPAMETDRIPYLYNHFDVALRLVDDQ